MYVTWTASLPTDAVDLHYQQFLHTKSLDPTQTHYTLIPAISKMNSIRTPKPVHIRLPWQHLEYQTFDGSDTVGLSLDELSWQQACLAAAVES